MTPGWLSREAKKGATPVITETGPAAIGLSVDTQREMYRQMVRARVLDERLWVLNRQGRAPFVISCQGHEGAQVGIGMAMRPGVDWCAPYYRDLALVMVLGMTMKDQMLASLAKALDPSSGGRQMPSHFSKHSLNIISTGSSVATQVLHAAGIAYAAKLRGDDVVVLTSLGEGSTSEGDFYEGLNFAAIHKLPVICVVENNQYAISVRWDKNMPFPDAAERAQGFGIPGVVVDGNDPIACYYAAFEAHQRARAGRGPTLIEAKVSRLTAHSSDDDEKAYRPAEELEAAHAMDCIEVFRASLEQQGILAPGDAEEIRAAAVRELDLDQAEAEACADPDPSTVMRYVTGENHD